MRATTPFIACPEAGLEGAYALSEVGLAIVGALCWGLAPVAGKVGLVGIDPIVGLALRTLMASALVVGFVVGSGSWSYLERIPAGAWLPIGIEAVLATLAGDLAYYAALKQGHASTVAVVMAASPLATVAAATLWLREPVSWEKLAGTLLIVAGVALVGRGVGG